MAVLLLVGCAGPGGADAGTTAPEQQASGAQLPGGDATAAEAPGSSAAPSTATVAVSGRAFEFDLRMCSVYADGEVLLSGLGQEVGADGPSHLDGDTAMLEDEAYAEFRIDIGADGPYQSSDEFISLGNSLGGQYALTEAADGYLISANAWDSSGADLGVATLHFACN